MMIKMHGVKLPNLKQTAGCAPERIPTPSKVTIPMSMHHWHPGCAGSQAWRHS